MIDDIVHAWFQSHRVPWVTRAMLGVSFVHQDPGLLLMAAMLALVIRPLACLAAAARIGRSSGTP